MINTDGSVEFNGWRLRFTWASLNRLHARWGEGFEERVAEAFRSRVLPDLAMIVEATGGPAPDDVTAASPPIMPLINELTVAWQSAYLGFKAAKAFEDNLKREATDAAGKKRWPILSWIASARPIGKRSQAA